MASPPRKSKFTEAITVDSIPSPAADPSLAEIRQAQHLVSLFDEYTARNRPQRGLALRFTRAEFAAKSAHEQELVLKIWLLWQMLMTERKIYARLVEVPRAFVSRYTRCLRKDVDCKIRYAVLVSRLERRLDVQATLPPVPVGEGELSGKKEDGFAWWEAAARETSEKAAYEGHCRLGNCRRISCRGRDCWKKDYGEKNAREKKDGL